MTVAGSAGPVGSGALSGRSALITGGAGGFGRAIASRLAADGAAVTLMGRTASTLQAAAEQIAAELAGDPTAGTIGWSVGDAASSHDVATAVAACEQVAPLGVTVAVVGGSTVAPLLALGQQTLEADFRRNVTTALLAIRHSASAMAVHGGGSIVCISSSAGGSSFPFMPAYAISKAALEALVRGAADELGHLGIRVNAVRPGLVATDAEKPGMLVTDPEQHATVLAEKPLAHTGTAADVAEAVRFLAGPGSAWTTGVALPVEGGSHLRRAPYLEKLARTLCGDDVIDAALAGRLPDADR
ncbi:SDR family NAD(P)-dependent oxidoreductase [Nakamurella lactea]|uniref:SDR family NAD(P)-dependent oxidoreductase n=1 Tax=Nakamurella lactea TaxID=459515 RepID=UPI000403AA0D|nr:SDR family oxidoreductase [Nakamurella lactea]